MKVMFNIYCRSKCKLLNAFIDNQLLLQIDLLEILGRLAREFILNQDTIPPSSHNMYVIF